MPDRAAQDFEREVRRFDLDEAVYPLEGIFELGRPRGAAFGLFERRESVATKKHEPLLDVRVRVFPVQLGQHLERIQRLVLRDEIVDRPESLRHWHTVPAAGSTFMQAVGMVNDHTTACFRYRELT